MSQPPEQSSLCRALQTQVIPWIEHWGMEKIFVATDSYQQLQAGGESLPKGMLAIPHPLIGKRRTVRSSRIYGSASIINARWFEDNLQAARTPKLCFILSGAILFPVADYQVVCRAGQGILIPPGVPFAYKLAKEHIDFQGGMKQCEILQLLPYQNSLSCWISTKVCDEKGRFSNETEVASVLHSKVPEYLKNLVGEAVRRDTFHDIMCRSWLKLLAYELYRELRNTLVVNAKSYPYQPDIANLAVTEGEDPIALAQKYIRRNLTAGLSINSVANFVCMSRTVFTEKFRQQTGMSFGEYVKQQRLQQACTLLEETDLSIVQVSKTVGVTTARLRSLFQQELSVSPVQYRLQHKNELRL